MALESLLERAKRGESLTEEERQSVRRELAAQSKGADPYTLIHILWKSRDEHSRSLIGSSITSSDEMVRRIALQALVELWPSDDIFEIACRLLVDDPSGYVRMAAATAVGEMGARFPANASKAAVVLLQVFDALAAAEGPEWEAAYEGLLELLNVPQMARPLATRRLTGAQIDPQIIEAARAVASPK